MRSLLKFYISYRLWIALLTLAGGIVWGVMDEWTFAWILVLFGIVSLVLYFILGNIRMVQWAVEEGDLKEAQRLLQQIRYPNLLIKPIRSVYHFMLSNIAMSNKDFTAAEEHIKKTSDLGMPMADFDGMAIFQHGVIAFQKGDYKTANTKLKESLAKGLNDKDAKASANLMLCSICIQRKDNKTAKVFFKRAKEAKPGAPEIIKQIKELESHIARMPG